MLDFFTKKGSVLLLFLICMLTSCVSEADLSKPTYQVDVNKINYKQKPIEDWFVCGSFNPKFEEISVESFYGNLSEVEEMTNPDPLNNYWYNGYYKPKYNQLDLKEIFNIKQGPYAPSLNGKVIFLACDIQSDKEADLFLKVKKSMKCYQYMNGELLHRREIQGLNLYPVHLKKGLNRYVIKCIAQTDDYSIETTILDGKSLAKTYVNEQSNNIIFPEISPVSRTISLTNSHQNVFDSKVKLQLFDVSGKELYDVNLMKDSLSYKVPLLKRNTSYMCMMTIEGQTVRQPVVFGSFDDTYKRLVQLRKGLSETNPRVKEIDQVLYRLEFLLRHETRKDDWWWQFKIAPLTYQLEVIFANLNGQHGKDKNEFNVQFVTYTSLLDNGYQRYLLVTPNKMEKSKKYPLVVVVRPHVENHHHFFTSPQFAHQWAINIIQKLANTHEFIVMMPEARMYHNEDVTPFVEAEMKLAIEDVKKHYRVDESRIYLHGICSGGYRALRLATMNPGIFAAIGLYAPSYHQTYRSEYAKKHSLESMMPNISGTPIMLFADPYDKHTPYLVYADLISDCQKYNIPLTLSQKINTELLYNAVVVGEEAFDFFDGKNGLGVKSNVPNREQELVVNQLYSSPFVYVHHARNKSNYYRNMVSLIQKDYQDYFFTKLPLVADTDVNEEMLKTKNLFLIGTKFDNLILAQYIMDIEQQEPDFFEFGVNSVSIHRNPQFEGRCFVVYDSYFNDHSYFKYPWIDGIKECFRSDEPMK